GIKDQAASGTGEITAVEVGLAAGRGDREALWILQKAAWALGLGVSTVINMLNPSCVILGGGVMSMGGLMWDDIMKATGEYTLEANLSDVQVTLAGLGERAGVLGAVALAIGTVTKRRNHLYD
ncbi:MAG TPA: ROK family protein, partial [Clostridia bacterium]|nr:ROK family protein [Clostridia bacterium]